LKKSHIKAMASHIKAMAEATAQGFQHQEEQGII